MVYSSYEFLFVLPVFIAWFYAARTVRMQNLVLLFESMFFLAWAGLWHLIAVAAVIIAVYFYFILDKRFCFGKYGVAGVLALLTANLLFFKYRHFIDQIFGVTLPVLSRMTWVVPLGISFYTFEAISGILDIRRRHHSVNPMHWSLFIMFFPHLIAGPIVRFRMLQPQFVVLKIFRKRNIATGLHLFTIGFLKKMMADPIGKIIDPIWSNPSQASSLSLCLALIGFSAQVYLDFSGYTDMGRGVARLMGFRLPVNFRAPYLAASPMEFFQRWHVSLSSWIRIFVFDVAAMAVIRRMRNPKLQSYGVLVVTLLVMGLFGLWHGAAWKYVLFGIFLGLIITMWAAATGGKSAHSAWGKFFGILVMQLLWLFSLILFRADNLKEAGQYFTGIFFGHMSAAPNSIWWCLVAFIGVLGTQAIDFFVGYRPLVRTLAIFRMNLVGIITTLLVLFLAIIVKVNMDMDILSSSSHSNTAESFIYFQF